MTAYLLLAGLLGIVAAGIVGDDTRDDDRAGAALSEAVASAARKRGHPFHLVVNCTNEAGIRAAEIYRGQVGVWRSESQFALPEVVRAGLLQTLANERFADFAATYGGFDKPDKAEAPIRVACRIQLRIDGVEKTSIQQVDGTQEPTLAQLATDLLDALEPLGPIGTRVEDLPDALAKLADGQLAPEVLTLRYTELPAKREGEAGQILRIEGGTLTRQRYAPGRGATPIRSRPLAACPVDELLAELLSAAPWELPINVATERQIDLELRVLDRKARVLGRPFARDEGDQQLNRRLTDLATKLGEFCGDEASK